MAWFTTEIPINEGPYKFNGLPGLIIEMYDTEQIFKFSLVSISTQKNTPSKSIGSYFDEATTNTFKEISESEFYKFRESYYKMSLSDKLKYINREDPSFVGLNIKNSDTGDNMNLANKKASKMNFIEKL